MDGKVEEGATKNGPDAKSKREERKLRNRRVETKEYAKRTSQRIINTREGKKWRAEWKGKKSMQMESQWITSK